MEKSKINQSYIKKTHTQSGMERLEIQGFITRLKGIDITGLFQLE